jgi:hypothetical protein
MKCSTICDIPSVLTGQLNQKEYTRHETGNAYKILGPRYNFEGLGIDVTNIKIDLKINYEDINWIKQD